MLSIRHIAKDYLDLNPLFLNNQNCLTAIESLLANEFFDVQMTGVFLAAALNKTETPFSQIELLEVYRGWIESYIEDWAVCDTFGTEVLSPILEENKQSLQVLNTLSKSRNPWARRISLISLIKAKDKFNNWNKILDQLLSLYTEEKNPLVKKAIRWAKNR